MAIELNYSLSERFNQWQDAVDLAQADETELAYMCFPGDVVFIVDGNDFSARWGWVTVLDFSLRLWRAAMRAARGEQSCVRFTENDDMLYLSPSDRNRVVITATYSPAVATVPAEALRVATAEFLRRMIAELSARFPTLQLNVVVASIPLELAAGEESAQGEQPTPG